MKPTHQALFIRTIEYIYKHIDCDLSLGKLATEVGSSSATLKRLFKEALGLPLGAFIRKIRMEHALLDLQNPDKMIIEIAMAAGFEDQSAFARRFKSVFGYSPSYARQTKNIITALDHCQLSEPEIIEMKSLLVQAVTKQGPYFTSATQAWHALKDNVEQPYLTDDFDGMFIGVGHDNPHLGKAAANQVRFSAGIAFAKPIQDLEVIVLESGCYAKFEHQGDLNKIGNAYHYIFGHWESEAKQNIDHTKPAFQCFDSLPNLETKTAVIYVPLTI